MSKQRVHELLDVQRSVDRAGSWVTGILAVLVVLNVGVAIAETVPGFTERAPRLLNAFEVASFSVFGLEYLARLWSCTADARYRSAVLGRARYALTPLMLIDLGVLVMPYFDLRPLRILRLIRLGRYSRRLMLLVDVVRERRDELFVSVGVALLLLVASSSAMYWVERGVNDRFDSIPATMWWGVATLTTVGYGDVTPITPLGKVLGGMVALIGVGMFALPAGILAGGFAEALQRLRKERESWREPGHCPHCGQALE
ncbi:MAG: ion transporter [Planctomycetota bacterium]